MSNKDAGLDFIRAVGSIGSAPPKTDTGSDLPDGFPISDTGLWKKVDTDKDPDAIPGNVKTDLTAKRGYFTTFRPWENCQRCKDDITQDLVALPEEGDYVCPHTNLHGLEAIYRKASDGKVRVFSEQEIVQKDGSVVVSIMWAEMNIRRKKSDETSRS